MQRLPTARRLAGTDRFREKVTCDHLAKDYSPIIDSKRDRPGDRIPRFELRDNADQEAAR